MSTPTYSGIRWPPIRATGTSLLYLPPHSPDLNPIEQVFAKLKALLRGAAARTKETLWTTIGQLLGRFKRAECRNYLSKLRLRVHVKRKWCNLVLVGLNGVGKSMLVQNIADQALIESHTVLFISAGQLLGNIAALESDAALRRRLRHCARPQLLIVDEVGCLSSSTRRPLSAAAMAFRDLLQKATVAASAVWVA